MRLRNHRSRGDQTQKTRPCQTRTFTRKNQPSHSVQNPHTILLSKTELLQTYKNRSRVDQTRWLKPTGNRKTPQEGPKNPDQKDPQENTEEIE